MGCIQNSHCKSFASYLMDRLFSVSCFLPVFGLCDCDLYLLYIAHFKSEYILVWLNVHDENVSQKSDASSTLSDCSDDLEHRVGYSHSM